MVPTRGNEGLTNGANEGDQGLTNGANEGDQGER